MSLSWAFDPQALEGSGSGLLGLFARKEAENSGSQALANLGGALSYVPGAQWASALFSLGSLLTNRKDPQKARYDDIGTDVWNYINGTEAPHLKKDPAKSFQAVLDTIQWDEDKYGSLEAFKNAYANWAIGVAFHAPNAQGRTSNTLKMLERVKSPLGVQAFAKGIYDTLVEAGEAPEEIPIPEKLLNPYTFKELMDPAKGPFDSIEEAQEWMQARSQDDWRNANYETLAGLPEPTKGYGVYPAIFAMSPHLPDIVETALGLDSETMSPETYGALLDEGYKILSRGLLDYGASRTDFKGGGLDAAMEADALFKDGVALIREQLPDIINSIWGIPEGLYFEKDAAGLPSPVSSYGTRPAGTGESNALFPEDGYISKIGDVVGNYLTAEPSGAGAIWQIFQTGLGGDFTAPQPVGGPSGEFPEDFGPPVEIPFEAIRTLLPGAEPGEIPRTDEGEWDWKKAVGDILGGGQEEDPGGFSVTIPIPGMDRPIRISFPGSTDWGDIWEVITGDDGQPTAPPTPPTPQEPPPEEEGDDEDPDPVDIGVPLPGGDDDNPDPIDVGPPTPDDTPPDPVDIGVPPIDPIDIGVPSGPIQLNQVQRTEPRLLGDLSQPWQKQILELQRLNAAEAPGMGLLQGLLNAERNVPWQTR